MRYYAVEDRSGRRLLAADDDQVYDLTAGAGSLRTFGDLAEAAAVVESTVDAVASRHCTDGTQVDATVETGNGDADIYREPLDRPVTPSEVWAAGVTYETSEQAREDKSRMPEIYWRVYEVDRPELFFKATRDRSVGPGEAVGIGGDSDWNVPEPELGVVLYRGTPVGYTVGNDVSSRAIEGENPLYLPQAKVYDRCCPLGPCVASPATVGDPHDLRLAMRIDREGETVYDEATTANLARGVDELVSYYTRHNSVPALSVLLTGTSLVPDDEFTLQPTDRVSVTLENVGTLTNTVTEG